MKGYIHARLSKDDRAILEDLKQATGQSESELVRRGLHLVRKHLERPRSAADVAGRSVGRFRSGPRDLSSDPRHLDRFGQ